ncbi:polysaccharide deacetylase family protein [Sphingomonas sp.]|uniref:polysaccharide deacetylase family protein n=1 Tax=Sphingomonas sp. TaxID=28214 RepID=UPI003B00E922
MRNTPASREPRHRTPSLLARMASVGLLLVAASPVPARMPTDRGSVVALTFDDLPLFGRYASADEALRVTTRLFSGLRRHHLPATGFVNEIQLEGPDRTARAALLARWLDAGMDLGNHTYSHLSLDRVSVDAYIADTARDETVTRPLLAARGRGERWFRYPYLETGPTVAARDRFREWLSNHGYRIAPVTMENADWRFAPVYDEAVARGDPARAREVRAAYLAFTDHIVGWYQEAGTVLFGREPAFVFLLHASRLNAAAIDDLARILSRHRLRGVTLDQATSDPAYATADDYAGPDGEGWLSRWSLTLHRNLPWPSLPQVPPDIVAADQRIDAGASALPAS